MTDGIGFLLYQMGGGSPKNAADYYGREIKAIRLANNELLIQFIDGVTIKIWDSGQSCCEKRYTDSDDDLNQLVGKKLTEIVLKHCDRDSRKDPDSFDCHDIVFLEIKTSDGWVTVATHNVHNGCYGGFGLSVDEI